MTSSNGLRRAMAAAPRADYNLYVNLLIPLRVTLYRPPRM